MRKGMETGTLGQGGDGTGWDGDSKEGRGSQGQNLSILYISHPEKFRLICWVVEAHIYHDLAPSAGLDC